MNQEKIPTPGSQITLKLRVQEYTIASDLGFYWSAFFLGQLSREFENIYALEIRGFLASGILHQPCEA